MTGDAEIELFEYSGSFICHNNSCCSNMFGGTFYQLVSPATAGLYVESKAKGVYEYTNERCMRRL